MAVTEREILGLKAAFMKFRKELGVTKDDIDFYITYEVVHSIQEDRVYRKGEMELIKKHLEQQFPEEKGFRVLGRIKSMTSILGKLLKERTLSDVFGFKIIVENEDDCYMASHWLQMNFGLEEIDDRIANPRENGYRDIKLILQLYDINFEVIVQSREMFFDAETKKEQRHSTKYPWKYSSEMLELASAPEFRQIEL